jgi:hypothetical protein
MRPERSSLIEAKAAEAATLLNTIVAGLRTATDGLEQFQHLPDEARRVARKALTPMIR